MNAIPAINTRSTTPSPATLPTSPAIVPISLSNFTADPTLDPANHCFWYEGVGFTLAYPNGDLQITTRPGQAELIFQPPASENITGFEVELAAANLQWFGSFLEISMVNKLGKHYGFYVAREGSNIIAKPRAAGYLAAADPAPEMAIGAATALPSFIRLRCEIVGEALRWQAATAGGPLITLPTRAVVSPARYGQFDVTAVGIALGPQTAFAGAAAIGKNSEIFIRKIEIF